MLQPLLCLELNNHRNLRNHLMIFLCHVTEMILKAVIRMWQLKTEVAGFVSMQFILLIY